MRPFDDMRTPLKVRLELRQMFERWLPRSRHPRPIHGADDMVDERSLLDLCQHYRLEYPGGAEDVAATWDESEQRIADGGPSFADLVSLGWVFFDGGRWIVQRAPLGTLSDSTYPSPNTKTFLTGLGKVRLVAKTDTPPPDVQVLAARILAENWLDRHIPIKDPDWLAGRLWERLCPKPQRRAAANGDSAMQAMTPIVTETSSRPTSLEAEAGAVDKAFLEWAAWCAVLGSFARWDIAWSSLEMQHCREAAHRAIDRQNLWGAWDNDVSRYAEVLEKTFAIPQDRLRYGGAPKNAPPRTLVSRADWLKWPDVEHLMMERLGSNTVGFAFGLLCSELEKTDIGPDITTSTAKVISFAADHPMALQQFLYKVDAVPALLVDMLLHQQAACLAAKLVIEWRPESGRISDRNLSREAQTKAFAVQDALSLLAYHLNMGKLDLEECASLVTWCYGDGVGGKRVAADSRKPIGRQLLGMVAGEGEELQSSVLQHLVNQAAFENNVPRACFAGVLDGLNCLPNALSTDASPIVVLYLKFARDYHLEWTDAYSLSAELAARLVVTAFAQGAPDRDALLVPFDSARLLRNSPDDERSSLSSSIAQTLRGHIRLLARAAAGWPDGALPTELCDALQLLISRSVIEHAEKGRVGALTDRYGSRRFFAREEGSPALDLTAAWRRMDGSHQEAMLQALIQSDDPVLLAELCQHLPAAAKPSIQARLRHLKPGEASTPWTWPELQNRIASLLDAGELGLAREYLDEAQSDLDRAPQHSRLGFFGLGLQLLMKEENWTALDGEVVPSKLDAATARQAQEQLDFFGATSQLLRPNGNLAGARDVLQRLAARPGAASTYKENAFAVVLQQLVGPTLQPLTGANLVTGESLLAEINAAVAVDEKLANNTLFANRGLLLLALQRPENALASIAMRRKETRSPALELIAVLAKSEMGLRGEATAILDAAILEFGPDDQFTALKNDLQAGDAMQSIASASVVIDPISSIRIALQQLTELPPSRVGDILGPTGGGLRGYLIRQVSRAVASLQQMAAMLRDRKNPADPARLENDLNTAVREVLGASLEVVKWNVSDQSLGGVTPNGTPGERDAVIRVSGQEVAIYEALVCSGLNRSYTKEHFEKLISYGFCDIYFHVTYSYAEKLKPLFDYLGHMLEHEVPPGLTYLNSKILEPSDFETSGYVATYRADHREVAVAFLIVDLNAKKSQVAEVGVPVV